MRIQLTVTIEMTEDQVADYAFEYGIDATQAAVHSDVADNVLAHVQGGTIGEFISSAKVTQSRRAAR